MCSTVISSNFQFSVDVVVVVHQLGEINHLKIFAFQFFLNNHTTTTDTCLPWVGQKRTERAER